jgi:hypothetical protein
MKIASFSENWLLALCPKIMHPIFSQMFTVAVVVVLAAVLKADNDLGSSSST